MSYYRNLYYSQLVDKVLLLLAIGTIIFSLIMKNDLFLCSLFSFAVFVFGITKRWLLLPKEKYQYSYDYILGDMRDNYFDNDSITNENILNLKESQFFTASIIKIVVLIDSMLLLFLLLLLLISFNDTKHKFIFTSSSLLILIFDLANRIARIFLYLHFMKNLSFSKSNTDINYYAELLFYNSIKSLFFIESDGFLFKCTNKFLTRKWKERCRYD